MLLVCFQYHPDEEDEADVFILRLHHLKSKTMGQCTRQKLLMQKLWGRLCILWDMVGQGFSGNVRFVGASSKRTALHIFHEGYVNGDEVGTISTFANGDTILQTTS